MLNLIKGQPQAGMTFPNCTPRAVNPAILLASLVAGESEACTLSKFEGFLLTRSREVLDEMQKMASDPLVVAVGLEFLAVCHKHDDLLTALDLVRAFRDGAAR